MRGSFQQYCFAWTVAVVVGLTLLLTPGVEAQAVSHLNGRVLDQQGAILPGVSLTLRGQETGLFRESVSNENGTFSFVGMTPGVYRIEAELPGFKKYQLSNLKLEIGKTVVMDVTLEVGQTSDEVTVMAEAPLVDTTSKEIGGTIVTQELAELPSINRNFNTYISLLPGATATGLPITTGVNTRNDATGE